MELTFSFSFSFVFDSAKLDDRRPVMEDRTMKSQF